MNKLNRAAKTRLRERRLERAGLPPVEAMFFEPGDVRSGKARRVWMRAGVRRHKGPSFRISARIRSRAAWAALQRDFPPQVPNPYGHLLTPDALWSMYVE